MTNKFFKLINKQLTVQNVESLRKGFYQFAFILSISVFFFVILAIGINLREGDSIVPIFKDFFTSPLLIILGLIIPIASIIFARRFPPAPEVIFHSDSQITTWKSGNNHLELSFPTVHFTTSRMLSKSGISTVMVAIFAIDDKPFFKGETPSPDPAARYRKDLCVYKAGTQDEADESIEIIKSFMAGTYDESLSKFDDL